MIKPILPGEDSRLNWRTINQLMALHFVQQTSPNNTRADVAALTRRPRDIGSGPGAVQRFVNIADPAGDYLKVRTLAADDTIGEEDIYLALPYPLRSLYKPGDSHIIYPPFATQAVEDIYITGSVVYGVRPKGGTGVLDPEAAQIEWLLLADGRYWAFPYIFRDVTNSCSLRRIYLHGGVPEAI